MYKYLCYLFLLTCVLTVQTENQLQMSMETIANQLGISNTGRAIILLAKINSKKLDQLNKALQTMKSAIEIRIQNELSSFKALESRTFADREYYEKQIYTYRRQLAALQLEERSMEKTISKQSSIMESKAQEVEQMGKQREYVLSQQDQDKEQFKNRRGVFSKGVALIDQSIELLEQARQNSFIEIHYDTYSVIGEALQEDMEPEFRPIAQTFLDIGQTKFADHELIRKSIRILQKLRNEYADSILKLNSQEQGQKSQSDTLVQLYDQKINYLKNESIKSIGEQVKDVQGNVQNRKQLIGTLQDGLVSYQKSQKDLENEFDLGQKNMNEILKEYEKELRIIDDCIAEIEKQKQ